MRWFQSPLLRLVEPVPLVSFSPCVNILKMTILPLRLISPLQERTFSGNSFRELLAVLLGDFIYPRQATPSICMIVMQWHGLNYLNSFTICISYVWFVHGISRSIVLILLLPWYLLGVLGLIFWWLCGWHVAFGLLVASIIFIMMLVDIMFSSMMLACGS